MTLKHIEILRLTNDGNDLDPEHLELVQNATNHNLNTHGLAVLDQLHANVTSDSGYQRPPLHGLNHLTLDSLGNLYWRDQIISSLRVFDAYTKESRAYARRLATTCLLMEEGGNTVVPPVEIGEHPPQTNDQGEHLNHRERHTIKVAYDIATRLYPICNRGYALDPNDAHLLRDALHHELSPGDLIPLWNLWRNFRSGYKPPWFHDVEHMTIGGFGTVKWKGTPVEYYVLSRAFSYGAGVYTEQLGERLQQFEAEGLPLELASPSLEYSPDYPGDAPIVYRFQYTGELIDDLTETLQLERPVQDWERDDCEICVAANNGHVLTAIDQMVNATECYRIDALCRIYTLRGEWPTPEQFAADADEWYPVYQELFNQQCPKCDVSNRTDNTLCVNCHHDLI